MKHPARQRGSHVPEAVAAGASSRQSRAKHHPPPPERADGEPIFSADGAAQKRRAPELRHDLHVETSPNTADERRRRRSRRSGTARRSPTKEHGLQSGILRDHIRTENRVRRPARQPRDRPVVMPSGSLATAKATQLTHADGAADQIGRQSIFLVQRPARSDRVRRRHFGSSQISAPGMPAPMPGHSVRLYRP